jgi:hypothetical protein
MRKKHGAKRLSASSQPLSGISLAATPVYSLLTNDFYPVFCMAGSVKER